MSEPLTIYRDEAGPLTTAAARSFGLDLATCGLHPFRTLGELFEAVERRFEGADRNGPAAYELALSHVGEVVSRRAGGPVAADVRLDDVWPGGAQSLSTALESQMGYAAPGPELGAVGSSGCLLAVAGVIAALAFAYVTPWAWAALVLIPLGVMMARGDPGRFGKLTLADLARQVRDLNYAALVEAGAAYRAEEAWEALAGLIAENTDEGAGLELTPETRLSLS